MKNKISSFLLLITILIIPVSLVYAAPPAGYYDTATGSGNVLRQNLNNIIDNHTVVNYGDLHEAYGGFGAYSGYTPTDKRPNGTVWCIYSEKTDGTYAYSYYYDSGDACGNYGGEGDCYNREHSWPSSWFNDASPMKSDMYHVIPTDGYVNGRRSAYPYGEVNSPSWTGTNGSKVGSNSYSYAGVYTGTVFEPIDKFKGDHARIYFYMCTRYYGEDGSFDENGMIDGANLKPWALAMMKEWHAADPVSQRELDRNDNVYAIQGNRNPFVDHPEWVCEIWPGDGCTPDTDPPVFSGLTSAVSTGATGQVHLIWDAAADPSTPITYNIYYATSSGTQNFSTPNQTTTNLNVTVNGLVDGTTYYFVVRAEDSEGNEDTNSVEISATPEDTTDHDPPLFAGVQTATPTGNTGEAYLSWDSATDQTTPITYNVYVGTTSGGQFFGAPFRTTTNTEIYVTGLTNGTTYFFVVRAEDNVPGGEGGPYEDTNTVELSVIPYITVDNSPPDFFGVTSATATGTSGEIQLSWDTATDPSTPITYNIYYATSSGTQNFTTPNTTTTSASGLTLTGLTDGVTYYFVVRAEDSVGNEDDNGLEQSATPNVSDTDPPVFSGLQTANGNGTAGQVVLTWSSATDPSTPITYNIYYAASSGGQNFSTPDDTTTNATGITVTGLTNGVTYFFVVRAEDSVGNEDTNSVEHSAAPYSSGPDTTPPTFAGIKNIVDLKDGKSLRLEWDQATDPEGSNPITYNVYYSIHSGGQYFDVPSYTTTNTSSLTITDLTKGQIYWFIVRAEDSLNNEESNTVELEGIPTKTVTPTPPTEPGTVKIYPNPAKNENISIIIEKAAFTSINIYSLNGDLVAEINSGISLIANNQAILETENLGSGIYFFVIKDSSGKTHTGKLGIIN